MLRFIAASIRSCTHPLSHPLIARLQPLSSRDHIDVFTFNECILTPIRILQQLDIDIFTNHQFYTIVFHTVWTRLANDKVGPLHASLGFVDEVALHLPLFNHSCDVNMAWIRYQGGTTIAVYTKRDVKSGEKLFSSYVHATGMDVEQRTAGLWALFEGVCLCQKCTREGIALA
ncbi:hypothetical protein HBH70_219710 [Parastagonospora nodorum]|nr:hypothetical protein HBI03_165510 [Parastagonospora nodorum]KAH4269804.1 hypothetical protein HBI04_160510 [Parastagonospora nodorum]KAH4401792.1 hypothetical protein HBH92_217830 [Parastagonospora nodorum]KAH4408935.1 hypothetical protein HBH93_225790 [Parastagonospora nodorum]KAH4430989.1 hypothetical protein HBH91_232790 [Parastagonospora nodorum]